MRRLSFAVFDIGVDRMAVRVWVRPPTLTHLHAHHVHDVHWWMDGLSCGAMLVYLGNLLICANTGIGTGLIDWMDGGRVGCDRS